MEEVSDQRGVKVLFIAVFSRQSRLRGQVSHKAGWDALHLLLEKRLYA